MHKPYDTTKNKIRKLWLAAWKNQKDLTIIEKRLNGKDKESKLNLISSTKRLKTYTYTGLLPIDADAGAFYVDWSIYLPFMPKQFLPYFNYSLILSYADNIYLRPMRHSNTGFQQISEDSDIGYYYFGNTWVEYDPDAFAGGWSDPFIYHGTGVGATSWYIKHEINYTLLISIYNPLQY